MSADIFYNWGLTKRGLPEAIVDGQYQAARLGRRGEAYTQGLVGSKLHPLADEGSYFTATNATLGTAITGTAAPTAFSATVALMTLFNNNAVSTGKRIYLDYITLEPKAAGTNGTNFLVAMNLDNIQRYASGGTAITPVNPNSDDSNTSSATLTVGALTAAAASSSSNRRVWHGSVRTVIKVVGDKYTFVFGASAPPSIGMVMEGTAQAHIITQCPPVVIGPQHTFLLHEIAASQSVAATWEFSMGWWER